MGDWNNILETNSIDSYLLTTPNGRLKHTVESEYDTHFVLTTPNGRLKPLYHYFLEVQDIILLPLMGDWNCFSR